MLFSMQLHSLAIFERKNEKKKRKISPKPLYKENK